MTIKAEAEPLFTGDMLVYYGKYYLITEGHKEFLPDKIRAMIEEIKKDPQQFRYVA